MTQLLHCHYIAMVLREPEGLRKSMRLREPREALCPGQGMALSRSAIR